MVQRHRRFVFVACLEWRRRRRRIIPGWHGRVSDQENRAELKRVPSPSNNLILNRPSDRPPTRILSTTRKSGEENCAPFYCQTIKTTLSLFVADFSLPTKGRGKSFPATNHNNNNNHNNGRTVKALNNIFSLIKLRMFPRIRRSL